MAEILSLKLHRKRKARLAKDVQAAENRAKFGRAKDKRKLAGAEQEKAAKDLDGHKRGE